MPGVRVSFMLGDSLWILWGVLSAHLGKFHLNYICVCIHRFICMKCSFGQMAPPQLVQTPHTFPPPSSHCTVLSPLLLSSFPAKAHSAPLLSHLLQLLQLMHSRLQIWSQGLQAGENMWCLSSCFWFPIFSTLSPRSIHLPSQTLAKGGQGLDGQQSCQRTLLSGLCQKVHGNSLHLVQLFLNYQFSNVIWWWWLKGILFRNILEPSLLVSYFSL